MLKARAYKSMQDILTIAHTEAEQLVEELWDRSPYSSGELSESIRYEVVGEYDTFSIEIYMAAYGLYQDAGVNGVLQNWDSPYSYTNKMPPRQPIIDWIKTEGIVGRDNKGRFITRESLGFLIQRSIFNKGLEPQNWIDPEGELEDKINQIGIKVYESIWDGFEDDFNKKYN